MDLPALGSCGCDRSLAVVAVVILIQRESVPCWLFLRVAAEYPFLLALPLLIPKHYSHKVGPFVGLEFADSGCHRNMQIVTVSDQLF